MENKLLPTYVSLKQGRITTENTVVPTTCGNSVKTKNISEVGDPKNTVCVLRSRQTDDLKLKCNQIKGEPITPDHAIRPESARKSSNIFLIENYSASQKSEPTSINHALLRLPRPIAPKIQTSGSTELSFLIEPYKKREDKRRSTHNEIERRRRDKINNLIFKIREIIPEDASAKLPTYPSAKSSAADSKSQILIRACEYIKEMQQEVKSLRECLVVNDTLRSRNEHLQLEVERLRSSNFQSTHLTRK